MKTETGKADDGRSSQASGSPTADPVNRPAHYTGHPSGVECITITEHMGFNLGNALKYIWRCDLKKDAIEDLKKARWYIDRELKKRESENTGYPAECAEKKFASEAYVDLHRGKVLGGLLREVDPDIDPDHIAHFPSQQDEDINETQKAV